MYRKSGLHNKYGCIMGRLKRKLFGWKETDAEAYRRCYWIHGGSINVNPDILNFVEKRTGRKVAYYCQCKRHSELTGAYPLIDNKHVGAKVWSEYPVSYDDVLFPISEKSRAMFPEGCNRISPLLKSKLINVNYKIARKGNICFIKDKFSAKSEKNRRNEYRKFIDAGGRCIDQSEFTAAELARLYIKLFNARFAGEVRCYDEKKLIDIITELRHLVFGNVLFVNDNPCAFDLIFYAESKKMIYFDVPNGGLDPLYSHLSPGSLIMWKNIHSAKALCEEKNKKMVFSIGSYTEKWSYKSRWSDIKKTGKPFF